MKEDRPPAFHQGLEQGRSARDLLPEDAPFTPSQREWLGGFLTGLLGTMAEDVPREPPSRSSNVATTPEAANDAHEASGEYHRDNPFAVRLRSVEPLLGDDPPLAYALSVDTEGANFEFFAGDRAGVSRQNDPDHVRSLLRRLSARGQEDVPGPRGPGPAWRVLLEEVDIETPSRNFIELLSSVARDREERRTLESLLEEPNESTTVSALLRRFPSARPRVEDLVSSLHRIEPSLHPIAASPLARENTMEMLLVGTTVVRKGVPASVGVAPGLALDIAAGRCRKGDWLPMFVVPRREFRLPDDPLSPIVFIGTGVAAATARAFSDHRACSRARGRSWVFLASGSTEEVLYQRDFERFLEGRVVARFDGVAGDVSKLVERIEAEGEMLSRWLLDESVVYVEAGPDELASIERALARALERHGGVAPEAARSRLAEWRRTRRLRFATS